MSLTKIIYFVLLTLTMNHPKAERDIKCLKILDVNMLLMSGRNFLRHINIVLFEGPTWREIRLPFSNADVDDNLVAARSECLQHGPTLLWACITSLLPRFTAMSLFWAPSSNERSADLLKKGQPSRLSSTAGSKVRLFLFGMVGNRWRPSAERYCCSLVACAHAVLPPIAWLMTYHNSCDIDIKSLIVYINI